MFAVPAAQGTQEPHKTAQMQIDVHVCCTPEVFTKEGHRCKFQAQPQNYTNSKWKRTPNENFA